MSRARSAESVATMGVLILILLLIGFYMLSGDTGRAEQIMYLGIATVM